MIENIVLIIYYLLQAYLLFMTLTIILSWFPGFNNSKVGRVMNRITDFYLGRFRGFLVVGFIDFTPLIGFAIYELALNMLTFYIIPYIFGF